MNALRNMINKSGKTTRGSGSPSAYIELLKSFPTRPISSVEELLATQKVIDSLIDREKAIALNPYELQRQAESVVHHPSGLQCADANCWTLSPSS